MIVRRQFLIALGASALAAPVSAFAQQPAKIKRLGVLMGYAENDTEAQMRVAAFKESLAELGWTDGRNLKIDLRWATANVERATQLAAEVVAAQPDAIMSNTTPVTVAVGKATRTIPVVFTVVSDPVGSGLVKSLARPGGNITGFINLESSLIEKWLQLLKEVVPKLSEAAVMFNPSTAPYVDYYLQQLDVVAPKLRVKTFKAPVRSESEIEQTITRLAAKPGSGLIVMTDSYMFVHRKAIVALAARHRLPTIYYVGTAVAEGGLISYGIDTYDLFRRAATYVDRILRGANPAELPVEQPTKFELYVNVKTARGLGLKIPQSILVRADKVIE